MRTCSLGGLRASKNYLPKHLVLLLLARMSGGRPPCLRRGKNSGVLQVFRRSLRFGGIYGMCKETSAEFVVSKVRCQRCQLNPVVTYRQLQLLPG